MSDKWNNLLKDKEFKKGLERLVKLNFLAPGFYDPQKVKGKAIFEKDMCIQSCFLSYCEIFYRQNEVIELVGGIDATDLTNLSSMLEGYGNKQKRTYHNSMIFSLSWFNQLMSEYNKEGFSVNDGFYDFMRLGNDYESIRQKVKAYDNLLELDMRTNHFSAKLTLDFNKGVTKLETSDIFMGYYDRGQVFLSEILEQDKPFSEANNLNFILPTGYRGHIFPLINVSEIIIK